MLKRSKVLTLIFVAGFSFSSMLSTAAADFITGQGTWNDFTVLGKKYEQISSVSLWTDYNEVTGQHHIYTFSYSNVGDMGARSRVYDDNGYSVKNTDWVYNSQSGTNRAAIAITDPVTGISGKSYYAKGQGRAYNGNGYTEKDANASRRVTAP